MRMQVVVGVVVIAAIGSGHSREVLADGRGDAKAEAVVADARKALGGEGKIAALKGLSMKAEFRRELAGMATGGAATFVMIGGGAGGGVTGEGSAQVSGSIQIDVLFPDKFYREEASTGGFAITRIDGFEGDRPFLDVVSHSPGVRVSADNPAADPVRAKAALKRTSTELARLMLGLVAGTQPGLPVTYAYGGQAESPDGTAHVIDVTGPEDFKARLFVDTATHLPLMLTYIEAEARPIRMMTQHGGTPGTRVTTPGGASSSGSGVSVTPGRKGAAPELTPEQRAEIDKQMKEAAATPPKMIEYRMFFSDYRDVSGILLPHRIVRGTAEKTLEEWDIKDFKVNPTLKADRFKVGTD